MTLHIQDKSPVPVRGSNRLSAAAGPIHLVMPLPWPMTTPLSILPAGEVTWQPLGLVQAA